MLAVSTPAFAASSPSSAEQFIADINALRAQVGVGQLSESSTLDSIAAGWTLHLENAGTLSHNPNLASSAPSNWRALGENVGVGPNVSALQQAFTNSPEHYANMVDGAYNQIGVAVQIDSNGAMWVTEDYMELPAAAPAPAPAATTPPTTAPVRTAAPVTRSTAPVVRSTASSPAPVSSPAPTSSAGVATRTTVSASSQSASATSPVQTTAPGAAASTVSSTPVTSAPASTHPATASSGGQVKAITAAGVQTVPASSSHPRSNPAVATGSINPVVAKAAIPGALLVSFLIFITRPRRPRRRALVA